MATEEGIKVKGNDPVKVRWTAKNRFHKAGDTSVLHRHKAEQLEKEKRLTIVK